MAITPERMQQLTALAQKINANPTLRQQILGGTEQVSPTGTSDFRKPGQRPEFQQDLGSTVGQVASDIGLDKVQTAGQLTGLQGEAIKRAEEERKRKETQPFYGDYETPEGMVITGRTRKVSPTETTVNTTFGFSPQAKELAKKTAEDMSKLGSAKRMTEQSLRGISTEVYDYSQLIADAYDEGGFGDVFGAGNAALRQRFLGGIGTKGLSKTGAIPGKKVELITKLMPILTQQGDKPGSVRLVATVFDYLSGSAPGANQRMDVRGNDVSLPEAKEMLKQTVMSMLRYAEATNRLGITNEMVDNAKGKVKIDKSTGAPSIEKGSELDELGQMLKKVSDSIYQEGSPEAKMLEDFAEATVAPLTKKIQEAEIKKSGLLSPEAQQELDDIEKELAILEGR